MFGTSLERPSTWAIIAIAALVLFGYKRLPEVTRSVGKSLRIFKTEMKGMNSDDVARDAADAAKSATTEPAPPAVPAAPPAPAVPAAPPAPGAEPTGSERPQQAPPTA
jgi:sec-independent protein translocase protein TatA